MRRASPSSKRCALSDSYKQLYQGQLPSSAATLYTVPGSTSAIIRHISVVNNDTVARTFALYRGGTAATNYITPPAMVVLPGGMQEWDGAMAMAATETLRGVASVATQLSITVDGDEIT